MNTRVRQQIKAILNDKTPKIFATIRENGVTRVQFISLDEREKYAIIYGDKIRFWDDPVQTANGGDNNAAD